MTTSNNLITISCHAPFQIEEDTMTHLGRQLKIVTSTKWRHTCLLNDVDATHVLGHAEHIPAALSIKIFRKNVKISKCPYNPNNYTKYLYESIKIPLNRLMFCLFQSERCNYIVY